MGRLSGIIGGLLYYSATKHLPVSYSSVKLGQKSLRAFCDRWMLKYCGKDVNIEK